MKSYSVLIEKFFHTAPEKVFDLFSNHTFFSLTGADVVEVDFREEGLFRLVFNGRGEINGKCLHISKNKIEFDWNVVGFNRTNEQTLVSINFLNENNNCKIILKHSRIMSEEAAIAKNKAWNEILENMQNFLS